MRTKENIINENTRLKMEIQKLNRELHELKCPKKYGIIRKTFSALRKVVLFLW